MLMAKKLAKQVDAETVAAVGVAAATEAPKFTPCRQCSNPGDCARAAKCRSGFK